MCLIARLTLAAKALVHVFLFFAPATRFIPPLRIHVFSATDSSGELTPGGDGVVTEALRAGENGLRVEVSLKYRRLLVQRLAKESLVSAKDHEAFRLVGLSRHKTTYFRRSALQDLIFRALHERKPSTTAIRKAVPVCVSVPPLLRIVSVNCLDIACATLQCAPKLFQPLRGNSLPHNLLSIFLISCTCSSRKAYVEYLQGQREKEQARR